MNGHRKEFEEISGIPRWDAADKILPDIKELKDIIKELAGSRAGANEKLSDSNKPLADKIETLSVSMFIKRKLENKKFTIRNKAFLQSMQIDDETGTLSERDIIKVSDYFRNDIEAFHLLVAQCYISKTAKYTTENQIYYASCCSRYATDDVDIFFVSQRGKFFVLFDEVSLIELEPYIKDYFGCTSDSLFLELSKLESNITATHQELQSELTDIMGAISNEISVNHGFVDGAISFFDFLGWKGLWQESHTEPLEVVSNLIAKFRQMVDNKSESLFVNAGSMKMSTLISISDTIAIFTPKTSDISENQLMALHSDIARDILEKSCESTYPIRGAISYGQYSIMNSMMIGPGIDECASWHEKCDWIGVHFTTSAQFLLSVSDDAELPQNIIEYEKIPLKSGIPRIRYAIEWHISEDVFVKLLRKTKAILPEIAAKYINTHDYLNWLRKENRYGQDGVGKQ